MCISFNIYVAHEGLRKSVLCERPGENNVGVSEFTRACVVACELGMEYIFL